MHKALGEYSHKRTPLPKWKGKQPESKVQINKWYDNDIDICTKKKKKSENRIPLFYKHKVKGE